MNINDNQRKIIISTLGDLYYHQWVKPLDAIKEGWCQALHLTSPELSKRLNKFSQHTRLETDVWIDVPYMYHRENGCQIHFVLDPTMNSIICANYAVGKSGVGVMVKAVYNGQSVVFDDPALKWIIKAACGMDNYETIEAFVNGTYETHPMAIINFKKMLEHGFGELFEALANGAEMFAVLVANRSKTCDELEDANANALLKEFGMRGSSERRTRTMFEVKIIKKEVEV